MIRRRGSRSLRAALGFLLAGILVGGAGCGSNGDIAEVHRRLSLRLEHRPPERAEADKDAEIRARIQSSLDQPQVVAWIRLIDANGGEKRLPLEIVGSGDALGRIPAQHRGVTVRYVIEAKDAAGLIVSLPAGARDGRTYALRFEGHSSALLAGTAMLSAWLATLLYLGAGAASVQTLRGRLSVGPAGLLAGLAASLVFFGVLLVGGIHSVMLVGSVWPTAPLLLSMSRTDLALVTLLWGANLGLGRRALLDEEPDGSRFDERIFATAGAAAGILTLLFLIF
jgi:hypothetical protein